jgi:hypothetical protein
VLGQFKIYKKEVYMKEFSSKIKDAGIFSKTGRISRKNEVHIIILPLEKTLIG